LEDFRKNNTDELTVLNYFDELEITPIILKNEDADSNILFSRIIKEIGEPRNYGLTPEQIAIEKRDAEEKRVLIMLIVVES
jgi:adenylate kinase